MLLCLALQIFLLLSSPARKCWALRDGDVCLLVRLSPVKFVKSFATWQHHMAASRGLSYWLRYTCYYGSYVRA